MTVIVDMGDYWIESILITRAARGFPVDAVDITLTKPGRFVGGAVTADADAAGIVDGRFVMTMCQTNNALLAYGTAISQVRIIFAGNADRVIGAHILIFLRR